MAKTKARPGAETKRRARAGTRKKPPPPWYRRQAWLPWTIAVLVAVGLVLALRSGQDGRPAPGEVVSKPVVGGDLHSLVVDPDDPDTLYVGSHAGVSMSHDGGQSWEVIDTLNNADAMGWAFTDDAILAGGHPGIRVSTDGGDTFEERNDGLPSTDVHALGAGGDVVYAGLAGIGTFVSTDLAKSWEVRSEEFGGAFMGRIHVDPSDEDHIVAPDVQAGAVESRDGGRTWTALGGVEGAMWVSWDPTDVGHIIVTGQGQAAESSDGGKTWQALEIPRGASIVEFSPQDPKVLYAAVLEAPEASVYVSRDGGDTWNRP